MKSAVTAFLAVLFLLAAPAGALLGPGDPATIERPPVRVPQPNPGIVPAPDLPLPRDEGTGPTLGPSARAFVLQASGLLSTLLVEAHSTVGAGEGSDDWATGAHLRAATSTVEAGLAHTHARGGGRDEVGGGGATDASAQADRVVLLDGQIVLEGIHATAHADAFGSTAQVQIARIHALDMDIVDPLSLGKYIFLPFGYLALGERWDYEGGTGINAVRLALDSGEQIIIVSASADFQGPREINSLPPRPAHATANATLLEATGGYRAGDDVGAAADGYAAGGSSGMHAKASALSYGRSSAAHARIEVPSVTLLGGLIQAKDLLATADAASDDTHALPQGFSRVGALIIDQGTLISPVPDNFQLEIPGVGMLHANEVHLIAVEDPDTSTTRAVVEAVALRLVLLDGGEGVGRETSVARARADAFAPRTPLMTLELVEVNSQINAGDVVTFAYTLRSTGTATLTEGYLYDDHFGVVCTYRLLRPGTSLPCTRVEVVEQTFDHYAYGFAYDAWGAYAFGDVIGHIEVVS